MHELEPKLIITTMHGQQHIKIRYSVILLVKEIRDVVSTETRLLLQNLGIKNTGDQIAVGGG